MKIGDRVWMVPETFGQKVDDRSKARITPETGIFQSGTVTYIHPSGRWYQVTFDCGLKECFFAAPEQ